MEPSGTAPGKVPPFTAPAKEPPFTAPSKEPPATAPAKKKVPLKKKERKRQPAKKKDDYVEEESDPELEPEKSPAKKVGGEPAKGIGELSAAVQVRKQIDDMQEVIRQLQETAKATGTTKQGEALKNSEDARESKSAMEKAKRKESRDQAKKISARLLVGIQAHLNLGAQIESLKSSVIEPLLKTFVKPQDDSLTFNTALKRIKKLERQLAKQAEGGSASKAQKHDGKAAQSSSPRELPARPKDPRELPARPKDWKIDDVGQWLHSIELDSYIKPFKADGIDGTILLDMDDAEIEKRIPSPLKSRKVVSLVAKMKRKSEKEKRNKKDKKKK